MTITDMVYDVMVAQPQKVWTVREIVNEIWPDLEPWGRSAAVKNCYARLKGLQKYRIVRQVRSGAGHPSEWVYTGKFGGYE